MASRSEGPPLLGEQSSPLQPPIGGSSPERHRIPDSRPAIEGFSSAECGRIYSGDFEAVLERFRRLAPSERDALIISIVGRIGRAINLVVTPLEECMADGTIVSWEGRTDFEESLRHLLEFDDALLSLYEQQEPE